MEFINRDKIMKEGKKSKRIKSNNTNSYKSKNSNYV